MWWSRHSRFQGKESTGGLSWRVQPRSHENQMSLSIGSENDLTRLKQMLHANEQFNRQLFLKEYFCNMICAAAVPIFGTKGHYTAFLPVPKQTSPMIVMESKSIHSLRYCECTESQTKRVQHTTRVTAAKL